jgi:pilus assembly protein CpaC
MAANKEEASFLAGGEIPIPVAQGGGGNLADTRITIQYKEYGIRLHFISDVINDSLVKLNVQPEVSSLDYNNSVVLSGFRIPALLTRRLQTTVDVRRNESLVLTGLFNDERQKVKTGIPLLMDLPILGSLFASTQWQRNESELLIVVTPVLVDPNRPRAQDLLPLAPDTTLPAREAIQPRLTKPSAPPAKPTPSAPVPPAQPPATPPANPPAQPPRR